MVKLEIVIVRVLILRGHQTPQIRVFCFIEKPVLVA